MILRLSSNGPIDLTLSNQPVTELQWDRDAMEAGQLYRAARLEGVPVIIRARSLAAELAEFRVTQAEDIPLPPRHSIRIALRRKFSLDLDLLAFYAFVRRQPALAHLAHRQIGLRPILRDSLLEALCLAIADQQVSGTFTDLLKRRLVEAHGIVYRHRGMNLGLFPSPETLARLEVHALRGLQFTRAKSGYIVELARRFLAEPRWHHLTGTDEEIVAQLCRLRGVGRWTAEYGAMMGLGLVNTLPAADIGLMRMVQRLAGLAQRPTEQQVRDIGERWSPWCGLVTFYLWHQEDSAAATTTHD